jgi:hypothetical protein
MFGNRKGKTFMSKKISMREGLENVLSSAWRKFEVDRLINNGNIPLSDLEGVRLVAIDDLNHEIDNFISAIEDHVDYMCEAISNSNNQYKE